MLLCLHDLLQTLLYSGHSLIHVVINTIDNRTLLNDELVQILENLGKLLGALGYALVEGEKTLLPICWISCSLDWVSLRIISMAPFWLWLNPYPSPTPLFKQHTVSSRSSSSPVA